MYTVLRIFNVSDEMVKEDISDELSIEIETRLRNIVPSDLAEEFVGDKEKRVKNVYTLSGRHLWADSQSEIMERLKVIAPVLSYAKAHDACMEINPGIFLKDYKNHNIIEISCSSELIQILSKYDMDFVLSMYSEEWKSRELGDEIPEPIPPSPMNCILHVGNIGSKENFNQLIDKIHLCRVDIPMNINEPYIERQNLAIMLSKMPGWYNNHNGIIETLVVISSALSFASGLGASFEITIPFDMAEYRHRNVTWFSFGDNFIQALAKFDMKFTATISLLG